ncbi:hypothetical protein [Streptomyces sp. SAJ15]|uniref:hypothetical protein n=1 Tax=Streptomyces sp. SAJ15 TaxID=2011095 RepID=UPI0011865370|nr:hypothetical protein [Streptomyces sp. SAJ15]
MNVLADADEAAVSELARQRRSRVRVVDVVSDDVARASIITAYVACRAAGDHAGVTDAILAAMAYDEEHSDEPRLMDEIRAVQGGAGAVA